MKEAIVNLLAKELAKLKLDKKEIESLIEIPPDSKLGDYAFPCFRLAGMLKKNPQEIANDFVKSINKKLPKEISGIKATGPYINFFLDKKIFAHEILSRALNDEFGQAGKPGTKGKILLEHTSVNPNAAPHVGRTRNSIIGDSIKRILEFQGYNVETHYYINDVSKQVAMLALNFRPRDNFGSLLKRYVDISKKIEKNPRLEKKTFELLHKFEHKDKKTLALFKKIVDTAIKGQKEIFSSIGINFDYFDYESRYLEPAKQILKELEKTGKLFKDKENRLVLNQSGTSVQGKMKFPYLVLTRSDGTGLYPLRDLAYTIEKCRKGKNILVLGEDQKLYFEQLKQALILLKKPYPEVVHYSFVLIKDTEGTKKMSTRRGEVVLLKEFITEAIKKAAEEVKKRKTKGDAKKVGIGAVKYSMLRNENDKNITFDWQQALSFEGDSGPYLQYSYARASSILKKINKKSKSKAKSKTTKLKTNEINESEFKLIKIISEFPEIVKQAEKNLSPSIIANYSFELAQIFNEFYHSCPVINADNKEQQVFRLKLVEAFRKTIKKAVYLLGIEVMEEM